MNLGITLPGGALLDAGSYAREAEDLGARVGADNVMWGSDYPHPDGVAALKP